MVITFAAVIAQVKRVVSLTCRVQFHFCVNLATVWFS